MIGPDALSIPYASSMTGPTAPFRASAARRARNRPVERVGAVVPLPAAPGVDPAPASLAPVLLDVPDRLALPEVGPLPAAPGEEPEPASLAPVLFIVPERVCPEPPSAAWAAAPRASVAAMARIVVRMSGSLGLLV